MILHSKQETIQINLIVILNLRPFNLNYFKLLLLLLFYADGEQKEYYDPR